MSRHHLPESPPWPPDSKSQDSRRTSTVGQALRLAGLKLVAHAAADRVDRAVVGIVRGAQVDAGAVLAGWKRLNTEVAGHQALGNVGAADALPAHDVLGADADPTVRAVPTARRAFATVVRESHGHGVAPDRAHAEPVILW